MVIFNSLLCELLFIKVDRRKVFQILIVTFNIFIYGFK